VVESIAATRSVVLTETTPDSGIFTGSIMTTGSASADPDVLPNMPVGANVTVSFADALPVEATVQKMMIVLPSSLGVLTFSSSGPNPAPPNPELQPINLYSICNTGASSLSTLTNLYQEARTSNYE